jgi:cytochrome c556
MRIAVPPALSKNGWISSNKTKITLKAIKTHFRNGDLDAIIPLAKQIRDWAEKMPAYFPAGSDGKPSEASPQIWLDFLGFERAANANYQAANQLVTAAKASDSEGRDKCV